MQKVKKKPRMTKIRETIYYPDQPDIDPISAREYRLRAKYIIRAKHFPKFLKKDLVINVNFETDDMSTPRALWWAFPPDGIYRKGAVPHDDIYAKRGKMSGFTMTRAQADGLLRAICKAAGVGFVRRNLIWLAVRIGGASHWGPG